MIKTMATLLLLFITVEITNAQPLTEGNTMGRGVAGVKFEGDTESRAEKIYSIGLICYAGGDLKNAEKFFAQALRLNPHLDKAAHALDQIKTERELAK